MKLQSKTVVLFNLSIIAVCVIVGFIGYRSSADGLEIALNRSARSNVNFVIEFMNARYPGDWRIEDNTLYKGDTVISGSEEIPDFLGKICEGHVTFFMGDTRVSTTVKDGSGKRLTNTKASEKIINEVLIGGKPYAGRATVVNAEYDCAYTPIKDGSGKIIGMAFVGLPSEELAEVIKNDLLKSIFIAVAAVVIVLGILSWVIIGHQMKKLVQVSDAMEEIAGGNLTVQDLEVTSSDEIGILSKDVNSMKKALRKLLSAVSTSCEQVAASSQELTASADQTAQSINQVAQSTVDMADYANKQFDTVGELQNVINDMGNKVEDLKLGAVTMNDAAKTSLESAVDGKSKIEYAIEKIRSIEERVNKSAKVVDELGNRSKEIGQIVEAISAIAEQTNLLALNAAIEAARAGEHGKGFAVVAEEVRKLAEQSASAAQNISALVKNIQADTAAAVEEMSLSSAGVKEGTSSVTATGTAFGVIEDQINTLNENIQRSIQHIEAVNKTCRTILNSIDSVQKISRKSAEDAQNISASTQEQAATVNEMSESSGQLSILAQKLQDEVNKFKV